MLLYKGWLETRFRVIFAAVLGFIYCLLFVSNGGSNDAPILGAAAVLSMCAALTALLLAGAGVATQSALLATRGLHGSTLYTLSLPVSRLRLIAVRAGLGWVEMAAVVGVMCGGMWLAYSPLKTAVSPAEMAGYAIAVIACTSSLYAITVLLSTFLDDTWRFFGSFVSFGTLWGLSNKLHLPASVNPFRAMVQGSPLIAHTMPWAAMGVSLAFAGILLFAASRIAQMREY